MKKLVFFTFLLLQNSLKAQEALGEVVGTILDEKTGETIIGAHIFIIDQTKKYQALTGEDGRFRITAIPAGSYFLSIRILQDTMQNIPIDVPLDGFYNTGDIKFSPTTKTLQTAKIKPNNGKIKLDYGFQPTNSISYREYEKSPLKFNPKAMVTAMSSEVKMDENGELMFRGARKGDMVYLMDGVKSNDISGIPSAAVGRMLVYTGGIPAKYGDTLGGVIVMETKSYFDLYREWERSNF